MMFPKPKHMRKSPKRGERGKFNNMVRQAVYEYDDGKCRICGRPGGEVHHILPKSRGGRGVFTNAMLVCQSCHRKIHQDVELMNFWITETANKHGFRFYEDGWDER